MHHEIRTTLDCFNILIRWSMSADFSLATVKSLPLTAENPKKKNPETKPVAFSRFKYKEPVTFGSHSRAVDGIQRRLDSLYPRAYLDKIT